MARNSPCNFWNSSAVCSGEPLNASWVAAFTNTFAGRTVSFVGDSLVRQAFLQHRVDIYNYSKLRQHRQVVGV